MLNYGTTLQTTGPVFQEHHTTIRKHGQIMQMLVSSVKMCHPYLFDLNKKFFTPLQFCIEEVDA